MDDLNLQLFGGGGSSSGLGGGYWVRLMRPNGGVDWHKFTNAKSEEEALEKARKYKDREGYIKVDNRALTQEEYDKVTSKKKK